jgi:hypothetical protein
MKYLRWIVDAWCALSVLGVLGWAAVFIAMFYLTGADGPPDPDGGPMRSCQSFEIVFGRTLGSALSGTFDVTFYWALGGFLSILPLGLYYSFHTSGRRSRVLAVLCFVSLWAMMPALRLCISYDWFID